MHSFQCQVASRVCNTLHTVQPGRCQGPTEPVQSKNVATQNLDQRRAVAMCRASLNWNMCGAARRCHDNAQSSSKALTHLIVAPGVRDTTNRRQEQKNDDRSCTAITFYEGTEETGLAVGRVHAEDVNALHPATLAGSCSSPMLGSTRGGLFGRFPNVTSLAVAK